MLIRHLPTIWIILGVAFSGFAADSQRSARSLYEESREGITVRLEKVTLERILDEPAWFRERHGPDWKETLSDGEIGIKLPVRLVCFLVSVLGDADKYGPVNVTFADYQSNIGGLAAFSPPMWQSHITSVKVDPGATGLEKWYHVRDKTTLDDLFPATVEVHVTTKSGKKLTFVFRNVGI